MGPLAITTIKEKEEKKRRSVIWFVVMSIRPFCSEIVRITLRFYVDFRSDKTKTAPDRSGFCSGVGCHLLDAKGDLNLNVVAELPG